MVRYAASQIPGLESAPVASFFQVNWKERQFAAASAEFVMDSVIIPTILGLLAAFPNRSEKVVASLLEWGLKHTTRPPYGAVLSMNAQGAGRSLSMTVAHADSYYITAAPTAACLLQYFDGAFTQPGLWRQGTLVEPVRFFDDLARMGVKVDSTMRSQ